MFLNYSCNKQTSSPAAFPAETGYKYKVAFGVWLNDMRSVGMPGERWPYGVLDQQAEKDMIDCVKLQSEAGYNIFTVWGLFATYGWPVDIVSAATGDRRARINRIIKETHDCGMKIVPGVGIYSWGYQEIIKHDPEVAGDSPQAMCASSEASFEWVKKIIDFTFTEFDFDGLHMESADLGRCKCEECSQYGDIEYHTMINTKTANYIREAYPGKIIMASTCGWLWGNQVTSDQDAEHISELTKHLDYFIIPNLVFRDGEGIPMPKWLDGFHCDFGSSSDFWIYPPQQWDRMKWFLPHPKTTATSLKQLYDAGGRAIEYYMGPVINPSTEFNIAFGGIMLSDPEKKVEDAVLETVDMLYAPKNKETAQNLMQVFFDAEKAYMSNSPYFLQKGVKMCELRLTGLMGPEPGPEYYISNNAELSNLLYMDAGGRKAYKEVFVDILGRLDEIEKGVKKPEKVQRIRLCIKNVIRDLDKLGTSPEVAALPAGSQMPEGQLQQ